MILLLLTLISCGSGLSKTKNKEMQNPLNNSQNKSSRTRRIRTKDGFKEVIEEREEEAPYWQELVNESLDVVEESSGKINKEVAGGVNRVIDASENKVSDYLFGNKKKDKENKVKEK